MIQIKATTEMSNNNLKLTIVKREEVKINGKPISKCSYEELIEEAKKFTETKGKGVQELKNEIVKGQRKSQHPEGKEGKNAGEPQAQGSGRLLDKNEQTKIVQKKQEQPEEKKVEGQESIKSMKAPFRTKVYLLATAHNMTAKDAAAFLGRPDRLRSAKKAIANYQANDKLKAKAQKLLGK